MAEDAGPKLVPRIACKARADPKVLLLLQLDLQLTLSNGRGIT